MACLLERRTTVPAGMLALMKVFLLRQMMKDGGAGYRTGWKWRNAMRGIWILATAAALAGCAGTMPAPVGLTAAPEAAAVYNTASPFSVGVLPTRTPPVRLGDVLGFTLSTSSSGYGHLYLINASGAVLVLVENLPVAAGAQAMFPGPDKGFTFRASPPAGVERVLFLVTRQPFAGFGGSAAGGPVQLAVRARDFIAQLNAATGQLPSQGWALAETRIEIVAAGG